MITVEGIERVDDATRRILDRLKPKERQKILRKGAAVIRDDARSLVSDAPDYVYRYSTPKVLKRRRAPKGSGVIAATYVPGNLRKSIKTMTFRQSPDVFVGPRMLRGSSRGIYGLTAGRVDPYYAHMVHDGTVRQKGQPFMKLAFQAKKAAAARIIEQELKKTIEKT